jgi:hypothetical protein
LKYNVAARESQEAVLDLDAIAVEFGEMLEEFLTVTTRAQILGAEFGIRGKPILERDFHSILTQLHPAFQTHIRLQRSIGEKRRSFGGFAARVLPEESKLVGVEELNKSGWFTLTYSDGIVEKVPRSKLSEYLSSEQLEKLNA